MKIHLFTYKSLFSFTKLNCLQFLIILININTKGDTVVYPLRRRLSHLLVLIAVLASPAFASDRSKVIDFEDEVVEGLNKKPLDSLSQISERDKGRKRFHLYRKRAGFSSETQQTLREARFAQ